MMSRLELSIAWRYLRGRRGSRLMSLISLIAIGGVIVGVSALILVTGVMAGLQRDLRNKILIGSPDIRVLGYSPSFKIPEWDSVLRQVRRDRDVIAAGPFVHTQGLVQGPGTYSPGAQIVGLPPDAQGVPQVTTIRRHGDPGAFRFRSPDGQRNGAVLGKDLAGHLNAYPGTTIKLFTLGLTSIDPVLGIPRQVTPVELTVVGIFDTGMWEYDNSFMYVDIDVARKLAGIGNAVTGIEVKVRDRDRATQVAERLRDRLAPTYNIEDWQMQNSSLFSALRLEKLAMEIILLLIVVVAAFNIVSTLTMVVSDKTREIGILKAMGLPARSIRRVFFVQGVVIGVVGTMLGVGLGVTIALAIDRFKLISLPAEVYFIDHLPVSLQAFDVVTIVIASLGIAAVATLYPANQAAALYPIEAIRHE